ncbi:MAG: DUF1919 domain-containing protein [Erysipelotrichia bacterium]|nr:DUF1919 domain-containing protein [Erysipelotrichia bacterium]
MVNKIKLLISNRIYLFNSKRFLNKQKHKNKNMNPTIISNNCVGGVIYHRLGLKFNSPTINLWIGGEDYLEFVKNLEYYKNCSVEEVKDTKEPYPVGKIVPKDNNHRPVLLHFQHYDSFEEAKKKWNERYKRINYDNLFFIWEFYDNKYNKQLIYEFDNLPVKKAEIIHNRIDGLQNACFIDFGEPNPIAKVFEKDGLSGKLYLDKFDYIKFLNE